MKNIQLKKAVIILLLLGFAHAPAFASVIVTFSEQVSPNQIQYYWNGEQKNANDSGTRTVSPTKVDVDATNPSTQASAFGASPPTERYAFASSADGALTNSQKIWIRAWNGAVDSTNGQYTALNPGDANGQAIDNPATAPANYAFPLNYDYIKAYPGTATITGYEERGTTTVGFNPPSGPASAKTVTFSSSAPLVSGKTVEISGSSWQITQGGNAPITVAGSGTSLVLNTEAPPAGITLNPGDSITLSVKHSNLWGSECPSWSNPETYTVGAGPGGLTSQSWSLVNSGTGINTISILLSGLNSIMGPVGDDTIRDVSTIEKLIREINRQAGANVVTVFGWWDETATPNQRHYGITSIPTGAYGATAGDAINASSCTATPGDDPAAMLSSTIRAGRCYQVTVSSSHPFTLRTQ